MIEILFEKKNRNKHETVRKKFKNIKNLIFLNLVNKIFITKKSQYFNSS